MPAVETLDLGDIRVSALTDANGSFMDFTDAFPSSDIAIERPELEASQLPVSASAWVLPFRAFLVRSANATVLVDAGVGPAPSDFLPACQGWLPAQLRAEGVLPPDVDFVVLTHLHVDHIGWTSEAGKPYFGNARYLAPEGDHAMSAKGRSDAYCEKIAPLERAGVLDLARSGEATVASGIVMFATPGHTQGHMSVRLDGSRGQAVVIGDVAVHVRQLTDPHLAYAYESDPALAASTRHDLLGWLASNHATVAAGHFDRPFGRVQRDGRGFSWIAHRSDAQLARDEDRMIPGPPPESRIDEPG